MIKCGNAAFVMGHIQTRIQHHLHPIQLNWCVRCLIHYLMYLFLNYVIAFTSVINTTFIGILNIK